MNQGYLTARDLAPILRLSARHIAAVAADQARPLAERTFSSASHRCVPPMARRGKHYVIWSTTLDQWLTKQQQTRRNYDTHQRFQGAAFR